MAAHLQDTDEYRPPVWKSYCNQVPWKQTHFCFRLSVWELLSQEALIEHLGKGLGQPLEHR
uniref:Uncharacterized protein n=1 Tax=Meleagris gallopavo TaxID=9103 RepID=A0A803YRG9_MELGA